jgi:uncharacterized membrane protein YkgB
MNKIKLTLILIGIIAFIYFFPRFIIANLGPADPWTSYLYQYGLGLIVFLVGILVILKSKSCQLGRGRDTFWFILLIFGFVFFAVVHALWIVASQKYPYLGGS